MEWFRHFYTKEFIEVIGFPSEEQTQREIEFIHKVLSLSPGARILDLCCGFGRHAFLLAQSGNFEVTGMDLSEDFLSMARLRHSAPNLRFLQGDMRHIPYENYFDVVLNLFTSFGYFDADEENEEVLGQIHKSLKSGGRLLLDYENKFYFVRNDVVKKERFWQQCSDGSYYLLENSYDIRNEREVFQAYRLENGSLVKQGGYNIRLYSLPELQRMFQETGLVLEQVWGDFDESDYTVRSRRVITRSRKA
jgi:SAM-dependent methyltransferase